jgi:hypothetical protein
LLASREELCYMDLVSLVYFLQLVKRIKTYANYAVRRLYITECSKYLTQKYRDFLWQLIVAQFLNKYPIIRAIPLPSTVMRGLLLSPVLIQFSVL